MEDNGKRKGSLIPLYSGRPVNQGEEALTILQYTDIVDRVAQTHGWTDDMIALSVCENVEGPAEEWLFGQPYETKQYWQVLRPKLIMRFKTPLSIREKIELRRSLKQKLNEPINAYHQRCLNAQELISDEDSFTAKASFEREVLLNFVLGLRSELQNMVIQSDAIDLEGFRQVACKAEEELLVETKVEIVKNDHDDSFEGFDDSSLNVPIEDIDDDLLPPLMDTTDDNSDIKQEIKEEPGEYIEGQSHGPAIPCNSCGCSFTSVTFLKSHIEREHTDAKINCKFCDAKFTTRRVHKLHMTKVHADLEHPCDICQLMFYDAKKLILHQAIAHRPMSDKFVCRLCSQQFNQRGALRRHVIVHHIQHRPFPCNVCDKKFLSKGDLEHHTRTSHLFERPYECDLCDNKKYASRSGYMLHRRVVHGIGGKPEPIPCTECPKTFAYKSLLKAHIEQMHSKAAFVCELCGSPFKRKELLRIHHIEAHTDDKGQTIQCPDCDRKFRVPCLLKKHQKSAHSAVRDYSCSYCEKTFKTSTNLTEHINSVHLDNKPYACDQCDFRTAYRSHLPDHVNAKHEKKLYPCPFCPHQSGYKGNLDKHIRNVHSKSKQLL